RRLAQCQVVVFGENDDAGQSVGRDDLSRGLQTVQLIHPDVHHHPIRGKLAVCGQRFGTIGALGKLLGQIAQEKLDHLAHPAVVFDNQQWDLNKRSERSHERNSPWARTNIRPEGEKSEGALPEKGMRRIWSCRSPPARKCKSSASSNLPLSQRNR